MLYVYNFILVIVIFNNFTTGYGPYVVTNTIKGPVRGYDLTFRNETNLHIFLGIPYAEPPIKNLRFGPPVEPRAWTPLIWNATYFRPACKQPSVGTKPWFQMNYLNGHTLFNTDEDCLYLNIYAPKNKVFPERLYPVMVWIHGGSFVIGSGTIYDGRILAAVGEVVVVTFDYRLGDLGFVSTHDSILNGNQGLLDQVEVLKWVNRNIRQFGGDPGRVTLFGQSAGGISASLHIFSPLSKDLFHGVIAQSGNALTPIAIDEQFGWTSNSSRILAKNYGCPFPPIVTSSDMVDCLRRHKILYKRKRSFSSHRTFFPYSPCVDGYFIHDLPENLLRNGNFNRKVRVMTGYLKNDAARQITANFVNTTYAYYIESVSKRYRYSSQVYKALRCHYPPSSPFDPTTDRTTTVQMKTDYYFAIPSIQLAEKLTKHGVASWLYEFSYRSSNNPEPKWMGTWHGSELFYLFGDPMYSSVKNLGNSSQYPPAIWKDAMNWTQGDVKVSRDIIKLWSDFAKLKSTDSSIALWWKRYSSSTNDYLQIDEPLQMRTKPRNSVINFWNNFNYLDYDHVKLPQYNLLNTTAIIG